VMKVLEKFNKKANGFLVFDAGALHGIGDLLTTVALNPTRVALTPHPGEWLKLTEPALVSPLNSELLMTVSARAAEWGATLCYKHATPIIVSKDLPAVVATGGSAILAKAGSGDVFAGIVAAHGAIGYDAVDALSRGYALLVKASEMAAVGHGTQGVIASDLIGELGKAQDY
jgi:NAD(P)H-hydrate repair Nnr-like enzyme with NAD(P)H-hydrate dehydratase domain